MIKWLFENPEEVLTGAVVGISFMGLIGWWALPLALITAILWRMGGSDEWDKNWRRLGVPTVVVAILSWATQSWIPLLSWLPFWGSLTLGYGIPDEGEHRNTIGGLVACYITRKQPLCDFITRSIIGFIMALCFVQIIGWPGYSILFLGFTIGTPVVAIVNK